jgi:DNA-binding NarL/FixJ family response regulator
MIKNYMQRVGDEQGSTQELTSRQREILQLVVEGRSIKEIAHLLRLSAKTVEAHRAQLMDRLNIHDVPGLVRYAIRKGIVTTHA